MQYVPLTVHLNALAQLYQQCASLSEKYDKLKQGVMDETTTQEPEKSKVLESAQKPQEDPQAQNAVVISLVNSPESISKQIKKIKRSTKPENVECKICHAQFQYKTSLRRHTVKKHQATSNKQKKNLEEIEVHI